MKKYLLLLLTTFFICCSDQEVLDIEYLKENGYKEITCSTVESYQTQDSSFVEINKKLYERRSYLLARCFDKDSCLLNINLKSDKIVCQRYIVSLEEKYKRDYVHSDFKEFVDHRVLYLSVNEEDEKEFIKRVN